MDLLTSCMLGGHCVFNRFCISLSPLIGQLDDDTLEKLEPDTVTPMKLSALLAFLGLFVLMVGSILVLWLLSRYVRRNYFGEPEPFVPSQFSEFSYKYRDQFDGSPDVGTGDGSECEDGLLPRREER